MTNEDNHILLVFDGPRGSKALYALGPHLSKSRSESVKSLYYGGTYSERTEIIPIYRNLREKSVRNNHKSFEELQ